VHRLLVVVVEVDLDGDARGPHVGVDVLGGVFVGAEGVVAGFAGDIEADVFALRRLEVVLLEGRAGVRLVEVGEAGFFDGGAEFGSGGVDVGAADVVDARGVAAAGVPFVGALVAEDVFAGDLVVVLAQIQAVVDGNDAVLAGVVDLLLAEISTSNSRRLELKYSSSWRLVSASTGCAGSLDQPAGISAK
jgi:hypothetical protein